MPYPSPADETSIVPVLILLSPLVATIALVGIVAALCVAWAVM